MKFPLPIKSMRRIYQFVLSIMMFCAATASAQDFSSFAASLPKMKAVFSRLLTDTPEFSAKGVVGLFNATNGMLGRMPMDFALTADRMRQDIDVMGMTLPIEWREATQKAHMDKIVVITQTDTKKVYLLFPGIQAYTEYPISEAVLDEMQAREKAVSIQKTEYKQETIENHLCIQTKLVVTESNKPPEFAMLRCATDLKNFPIRMDLYTTNSTTRFAFEDVQLKKPDASLFEVPTNFVEFPDAAAITSYAKEKLKSESVAPQ